MTSLERQLKKLKTPQTDEFRLQKYRASFLYDKKDAAGIDCATHLRIAAKGFNKLVKLNEDLDQFSDLFSEESKDIERSVLTHEENAELSTRLRKLINSLVVPFFMLNHCHEALEYLIYKYKVHQYESDDLLCALLPYHETRLFARALQVFQNFDENLWGWLEPYKHEGVPVPKERLLTILSTRSKLPLVTLLGDKLIEINKDSTKSNIWTSFYTTTMMCVLDRDLDERFFVAFMPHIYKAIKKSNNSELFMAGLVLIGYLAYTQELDDSYLDRIRNRLTKTHDKLREKTVENKEILDEYYQKVMNILKRQLGENDGYDTMDGIEEQVEAN